MTESKLYSLLLIKRLSAQTDRMIERIESVRSEPEAVQLAEQRARRDSLDDWTHCAVIKPDGEYRHGVRCKECVVWDVIRLP